VSDIWKYKVSACTAAQTSLYSHSHWVQLKLLTRRILQTI